ALQQDVRLNCKLGTGATRSAVEKQFGKLDGRGDVVYQKYRLHFSQGPGGLVEVITITPASAQATF
ncbi:MAG: hypothetical protein H7Z41_12860, partial [Cytophagales bacterium]|nr:hypothetical protein [Armatimonadota bacterium]